VSDTAVALVFAAAAVVALAILAGAIRTARRAGDFDSSTALVLATGGLVVLADVLVALTGTLRHEANVFKDIVKINPGWYGPVDQLALLLLAGLALFLLLPHAASPFARAHVAGVLAVLLMLTANASSALGGGSPLTARGGVLLTCLLAATVLPRGRGASLGAGIFGVSLAAVGGLLALFRYDVAFVVPCEGACSGPGFTGALPNENLLGAVLTVSIPFAYLGFRGSARLLLCLYLVAMSAATGSRTAAIAAVTAFALLLVVRPELDQVRTSLARTATAWAALTVSVSAAIYMVVHHWAPDELTTRPQLWDVARRYIHDSPWFGYGPSRWASLFQSSEIPAAAQHSTHNQVTDVLFTAGAVGAALLVGVAVAAIWTAGRARNGVLLVLTTVALVGAAEGAWSIGTIDLLSFSLVALVLVGDPAPARRTAPARAAAVQPGAAAPGRHALEPG
jgi:O-antigen ligase